ncbi:RNA-binding protein 28 isoform X2 [Clupea harengus]|uniref:RNA-binding protein 28 n=1 Tax=Clupea harengus TaxID=7950 RepID=A0A8M1KGX3_CLUHA|nr:RNA-binding protein 28 isoform X2 [Clupea harengus]
MPVEHLLTMSSSQTLFVQNLPATATNDRLEEIFSEIGPVKHCFVVNDKESGKCRGIGYVTFPMAEDAQRALSEIRDYDGKKIRVLVAKKKIIVKKKKASKEEEEEAASPKKPAKADKKPFKNSKKKARLIVRNLSFKCSEDDLRQFFAKYGTVLEASIPLKPDGKMRGFAFVQFKNIVEANKALRGTNLKEIKGRQVAVDWAIAKDKFVGKQPTAAETVKQEEEESAAAGEGGEGEDNSDDDDDDDDDGSEEEDDEPAKKATQKSTAVPKKAPKHQSDEEEEDGEEEDGDDNGDDDDKMEVEEKDGSESESADSDDHSRGHSSEDDYDDDDDDDDDDDSYSDDDEDAPSKKKKRVLPSDVNEGKTVFIRNLSFDTEEDGLEKALLTFGELNYVRVVIHPDTESSKGVAFAQFKSKEAADKCIAAAEESSASGGLRVDGRRLIVVAAVSREDAVKLKDKKVKVEMGSRNLYLAREGLIREGTKSAEGVPPTDMVKRARFEDLKRAKLRDISIFVSKTRLCVHNLPKSVDQKRLRGLSLQAAGGSRAVRITECRVMYDRKPEKGQMMGQSLGYGFVEFQEHDHALKALRHLNNNPDIFGPSKRPIVEFSLEDRRKLKIKEMRKQQTHQQFRNKAESQGAGDMAAGGRGKQQQTPKQPQQQQQQKPKQQQQQQQQQQQKPKQPQQQQQQKPKQPQQQHQQQQQQKPKQPQQQQSNPEKMEAVESTNSHHSGFKTTPEVEQVELADGKKRRKVLPLPSKRGPKIRARDKGKRPPVQPKTVKKGPTRKEQLAVRCLEKVRQPKKQNAKAGKKQLRNREDDRFDSLVQQYKRKLMGNSAKTPVIKKSKWFSS